MDLIKICVLAEIFSCYLFNLISSCCSFDGKNKVIVFISPCHAIFYKNAFENFETLLNRIFLFLSLCVYTLLFLVHQSISRSCFQNLCCLVILPPLLSLSLTFFYFCCINQTWKGLNLFIVSPFCYVFIFKLQIQT